MWKKWTGLFLCAAILLTTFSGCRGTEEPGTVIGADQKAMGMGRSEFQTEEPEKVPVPMPESLNSYTITNTIVESENAVFHIAKDRVWRTDRKTKKTEVLCSAIDAESLLWKDGFLYVSARQGIRNVIYRVAADTGEKEIVADYPEDQTNMRRPNDFYIDKDEVIFFHGLFLYRFDRKSHTIVLEEELDTSVDVYQGVGKFLYYIPHSDKTFTIYRYNLETRKKEVVLGKDTYKPSEEIIHDFLWTKDALYYNQRMPTGFYQYKNGKARILDDGNLSNFYSYQGCVYYVYFGGTGSVRSYLFCYNPKTGEVRTAALLRNFVAQSGFAIVDGYVYYEAGETYQWDKETGWSDDINGNYVTAVPLLEQVP